MSGENSLGTLELENYFGIKNQSGRILKINLDENPMTDKEIVDFLMNNIVPERLKYLFPEDKLPAMDDN